MAVGLAADVLPDNGVPDLDEAPMVEAFVAELGLGRLDRAGMTSPFGRNDVWAGSTSSGRDVFVKRLRGPAEDVEARFRRLTAFEVVAAAQPADRRPAAPSHLGGDPVHGIVVYELVAGGSTGAQHMVDETFDSGLAHATGVALAGVHEMVVPAAVELDTSAPALPSLGLLDGLPLTVFETVSHGQLEAWRLQQNDAPLRAALQALDRRERAAERVPAHCDLRVDQLLVVDGQVLVADWEEFRLADPARDIGSFAGEWLYRSALDIVTTRGDAVFDDSPLDHDAILRRGVDKLLRLRPLIERFWAGYRSARVVDSDLAVRATAFAGWHLLDRLLAGSAFTGRSSGIERAAAGIGRGILLDPTRFVSVIGLGN